MKNQEIAQVFETIADLLSVKGEAVYRVLAYRRAAESIRELPQDVVDLWEANELRTIQHVGEAIASKIDELLRTGRLEFYDKLTAELPSGVVDVLKVPDVGPKKAGLFYQALGIDSVAALEEAAVAGKLRELAGMGEKSEAKILDSIQRMKKRQTGRILLDRAAAASELFLGRLRSLDGVLQAESAGSLRRMRETVGDLDLVVAAEDPRAVMAAFIEFPEVDRVRGQGETKASVELEDGLRIQLWVHPAARFGSALQYATGSQAHNVHLRELALAQGLSLSEHGFKKEDGTEILCPEEALVYETLGLPWITPELREDTGELEAALNGELPELLTLDQLQGEVHAHTDWSDGRATMAEMAQAAIKAGLRYLGITDHSQSLGVARGLSPERLLEQRAALDSLQGELGDKIRLLHGTEVEILADGRLDYPDDVLAELDIVIASLHTSLRQPREQITERLLGAIRNPNVDAIGHPTGRLLGSRDPADLDMEAIFAAAGEHGVALEINANPERLDLRDAHARRAVELGCLISINTDAHHPDHLALRRYGVATARRGWVPGEAVINTWSHKQLLTWLGRRRV